MLKRKFLTGLMVVATLLSFASTAPQGVSANHESCGTLGSPDAIERCVTDKRNQAYTDCYKDNKGNNAEVESCVSRTLTHYGGVVSTDKGTTKNIDNLSGACKDSLFFGIPTWYKYLPKKNTTPCELELNGLNSILLILLAVVEILTRLAAFLAVGYMIWGGIKFTMSQGEPEGIANARNTIINAAIGLVLTVLATALITFIGGRIS